MEPNSFFVSDVEFSSVHGAASRPARGVRRWLQVSVAAALTASGLLVFYHPPASVSDLDLDLNIVRRAAKRAVESDTVSPVLSRAAAQFAAHFVEAPPTEAEFRISTEYDI
jgi:hypothetical protein